MACAARLEQRFLVMRGRPDANILVFEALLIVTSEGFATLPQMKGRKGFVCVEA